MFYSSRKALRAQEVKEKPTRAGAFATLTHSNRGTWILSIYDRKHPMRFFRGTKPEMLEKAKALGIKEVFVGAAGRRVTVK